MSTQARAAYGVSLKRYNGTAYASIEEVTSVAGPAVKVKAVDVTNMDSGGVAEYLPTILEPGTITAEGNFTNGTNQGLAMGDMAGKTLTEWEVLLPGTQPAAGYFQFYAYVIGFTLDFKVADRITYKLELQITGPVLPLKTS
jgi:hypothetical protein